MGILWHVFTGDKDPGSLQSGKMPVGMRIMASLDSALNIIGAERQGENLKFLANGESVTESEFRKLADMADGSPGLVVLDSSGVERIRADYS
jgi:hypothetical protein